MRPYPFISVLLPCSPCQNRHVADASFSVAEILVPEQGSRSLSFNPQGHVSACKRQFGLQAGVCGCLPARDRVDGHVVTIFCLNIVNPQEEGTILS
jgi:hypothetical protein